jgi:hypothetical protein
MEAFGSPIFWIILLIVVAAFFLIKALSSKKPGHYSPKKMYPEDEEPLIGKRKGGTYL